MKNFIVEVVKGTMGGPGVFYGHAQLIISGGERVRFTTPNHLTKGVEFEFRAIQQTKAGFNTIHDFKCKAEHLWGYIVKQTQCVQVKMKGMNDLWCIVYGTKGQKWHTVDVLLLDIATVGIIHSSAPKMVSFSTWEQAGAKTHADLAFVKKK